MSRALRRHDHRTVERDGSIRVLYGPANEPSPNEKAGDANGDSNNPQSGATSTKPHDSRMLTVGRAVDAATVPALPRTQDRYRNGRCSTTHARAPLIESPGCLELDADMTRMTPMAAAARCDVLRRLPQPRSKP